LLILNQMQFSATTAMRFTALNVISCGSFAGIEAKPIAAAVAFFANSSLNIAVSSQLA